MDGMMQNMGIILVICAIRAFFGFACFWIVFDKFFSYTRRQWKNINWVWIAFYIAFSLSYRLADYGPRILSEFVWWVYLVRVIPFLWAKYGIKPKFVIMVLFYENIVDCFAQNVEYLFVGKLQIIGYPKITADISEAITEIIVFAFLMVLILLKRVNIMKIYFTELTILEYVILFLTSLVYSVLQASILRENTIIEVMRLITVIMFLFLMIVIMHVIMVRDENISMNAMIGNLKEPMKQITASYIEMNDKNTELRRFRHDTKNLLLALSSLLAEGKYEQASDYIVKMQEMMETIKIKAFDTGNFIADALLESKAKTAAQNDIIMTVEGNIPANRIEDVNLVILISNLVDNALEAAKKVEGEKKIEIQSILKKNIWILSVKNSCVQDVIIRENRIETTKEEKESHGFGISNIERVAKKYGGNLKLSCENRVFTARATLMLMA